MSWEYTPTGGASAYEAGANAADMEIVPVFIPTGMVVFFAPGIAGKFW